MRCPYAYLLGVPGKGVHSMRFGGLAVADMVMTILAALGIAYFLDYPFWTSFAALFVGLFVLGELLHYGFGTQTAFLTMIGIRACV